MAKNEAIFDRRLSFLFFQFQKILRNGDINPTAVATVTEILAAVTIATMTITITIIILATVIIVIKIAATVREKYRNRPYR